MVDYLTPQDMAAKLLTAGFGRDEPPARELSDPVVDTPMQVTLDQLRPYTYDPRVKRNPAYEEIKASIRERGLDAPPAITRRPGEDHYIIRNGGNTRLAILRELWAETRDERFFRLSCLFRPWPVRGEIVMLTGHLAENELRGNLTFIERALAIEKARGFYEQESGTLLSQSELARRLTADGYPALQPHISRMQEAVRYLLPVIPTILYGGLGRRQVERLTMLRRACERAWGRHIAGKSPDLDFSTFFQDVVAPFDTQADEFAIQRVLDELVGQMAEVLRVNYDTLMMEIDDGETRQRVLSSDPTPAETISMGQVSTSTPMPSPPSDQPPEAAAGVAEQRPIQLAKLAQVTAASGSAPCNAGQEGEEAAQAARLDGHIVSHAPTTERLQSIQRLVADQLGDPVPDFASNVLCAVPVQAGGLYPISDVWFIEPGLDEPGRLRVHIAQFAREIGQEAAIEDYIDPCDSGIGFRCRMPDSLKQPLSDTAKAILILLASLSMDLSVVTLPDRAWLVTALAPLLHGQDGELARLSDVGLVKLFRLLRLARRVVELENRGVVGPGP